MRYLRPLIVSLALALVTPSSSAQRTFRSAGIDATGHLRAVLASGEVIRPAPDSDQAGVEQVAMSPDRRTVGWLALYSNCCTSYPIPLKLVLLHPDGRRTVIGNDLPIWQWAFTRGARRVVIRQAPVHGAAPTTYEWRDVETGRVVATVPPDAASSPLPAWVPDALRARAPVRRGGLPRP